MVQNPKKKMTKGLDFGFVTSGLIGGGVGLTCTLILILIMPFLLLKTENPNSIFNFATIACAFIGSGVGSLVATFICDEAPIQSGLITALTQALVLVLISLFLPGNVNFINCAIILASILLSAVVVPLIIKKTQGNRNKKMKRVLKRR